MTSLDRRAIAEEQMDAEDLPQDIYAAVLADLSRVNAVTLAARPTLGFLDRAIPRGGTMRLLDVGFGHGDMLRRIAAWAQKRGVAAYLVGIDLNEKSAEIARAATDPSLPIDYRTGDYATLVGEHWDIVTSSLVAHHMSTGQLVRFLRFMEQESERGWFVNDLHRHRLAHFGFPLLARAMRWHPIVREDGTLSIARSYRPNEWPLLLEATGLPEGAARVKRCFPFRLCVERLR